MSSYKLHIKHYQILTNAELTFHQGLTLITGPSNHGKSSLIKALQQLLYNQPGTHYIQHNHTKSTIQFQKFTTQDNSPQQVYSITYTKDSSSNGQYDITTQDNPQPQRFTKLGSSQLDHIKELTHIDKQLNYNFWQQMDKPFMLSLSNKEQFDLLQQSPHTHTLNQVQQQMTTDRKAHSKSLQDIQAQIDLIQQQNQQFTQQLTHKSQIDDLYTQSLQLQQTKDQIDNILSLLKRYDTIDLTSIQHTITTLQQIPPTTTLKQQEDHLNKIKILFNNLTRTVNPINEHLNSIQQLQTQQDRITLFKQTHFTTCPLCHHPFNQNHTTH